MKLFMEKSMKKTTLCTASVGILTTIAFALPSYAQDIQATQADIRNVEGSDVVSLQLTAPVTDQDIKSMQIDGGYVVDVFYEWVFEYLCFCFGA